MEAVRRMDLFTTEDKEADSWEKIFANSSFNQGLLSKISKNTTKLIQLYTKQTNIPIKKMARGPEQALLPRRHTDVQQIYEKMVNFTSYLGKANEMPPHTC